MSRNTTVIVYKHRMLIIALLVVGHPNYRERRYNFLSSSQNSMAAFSGRQHHRHQAALVPMPSGMIDGCDNWIERRHVMATVVERSSALTCHHLRPVCQGKLVSKPALTILPLIPAPSKRPNTVRRNKVTTSWSRGESRSGACKPFS